MDALTHQFANLDTLIDAVHDLLSSWRADDNVFSSLDEQVVYQFEVAVHEWMANLVQHARFRNGSAVVQLRVWPDGDGVRCLIEDNSEGFDMDAHLKHDPAYFSTFPERGMGLLMLKMSTQDLCYQRLVNGRNKLSFFVSAASNSWPNIRY